jgi:hypothetical protein
MESLLGRETTVVRPLAKAILDVGGRVLDKSTSSAFEYVAKSGVESVLQTTGKFTAIQQSEHNGRDWPLYSWIMRLFEPYISEIIFDGKHQVVLDNAILFDAWIYARDPAYYAKFHGKNAFLVHPYDEFFDLGVDRYVHFRGVFRQYWSSVFNPRHVMVFPLGSNIQEIPASVVRASDRRYAWSFIGEGGKSSRPDMVRAMSAIEPHICFSTSPIRGNAFFDRNLAGQKRIPLLKYSGNPCLPPRRWETQMSSVTASMTPWRPEPFQLSNGG